MTHALLRLFRPRLALLNGITALAGYFLYQAPLTPVPLLVTFWGVTLLAMGASAINQVLERDTDALMTRTMLRPLPLKRLSPTTVLLAGSGTILGGLIVFACNDGLIPALLGVAALLWYLVVYTPLKRKTAFALPLGALCGAFPPLIGWSLAGGTPTDYRIIILAGLLFIWQIPHFWLLQERHEEDYRRADIPLACRTAGPTSRNRLFWLWLIAFITCSMLLPALNIIARPAALWYVFFPVPLIFLALMHSRNVLFTYLNLFPLLLTLALLFRT